MSLEAFPPRVGEARDWIGDVKRLQRRTRIARQGFWFPLLILGLVVLASTPLYFQPSQQAMLGLPANTVFKTRPASMPLQKARPGQGDFEVGGRLYALPNCTPVHGVVYTPCGATGRETTTFSYFPGGGNTESPRAVALYWLIALPLSYLLIGWWYLRRANKRGISTSPLAYMLTGIGLVALLVGTSRGVVSLLHLPAWVSLPEVGDLGIRGLSALLTVGIGLFVLAYRERSRTLAIFTVAFLALAGLVNLYDLENLARRMGIAVGPEVGVFVVGLFMVGGGLSFAISHRRAQ